MAKVKQAPREDGVGAYAMATLCCPSAVAAAWPYCPGQQEKAAVAAAVRQYVAQS